MAAWPSELCFYPDYSFSMTPNSVNSEYVSGRSRARSYMYDPTLTEFPNGAVFDYYMIIDDAELAIFEDFWANDQKNGADLIFGNIYIGTQAVSTNFRIVNGNYQKEYLAFNNWKVSMTIEVPELNMDLAIDKYNEVITNGGFS